MDVTKITQFMAEPALRRSWCGLGSTGSQTQMTGETQRKSDPLTRPAGLRNEEVGRCG